MNGKYLAIVVCMVFGHRASSQSPNDSLLNKLNQEIALQPQYVAAKLERIDRLKASAAALSGEQKFEAYTSIYNEYKSFIYDSAFLYARKLQDIAVKLHDPRKITHSRINVSFVLISAGLFNEAWDTLKTINPQLIDSTLKIQYYFLKARTCYDLADFDRDEYYRQRYTVRANAYVDSAMMWEDESSADYLLLKGLKSLHLGDMQAAKSAYEKMINDFQLTDQHYAVATSTLSFIYTYSGEPEKAKEMIIRAAIADIHSSTKETLAMLNLADLLFKEGDVESAYKYIRVAMNDADFYGARHRKAQVAAVFPVIEGKQLGMMEKRKDMLLAYSSLITIFTLSVIGFSIVIYKQNKKLQLARQTISKANESLTETNHQLFDANKIKEEYIWYYFTTTADYISKMDALKRSLDLKLLTRKLDDIRFTVDSINIKRERDELYHNFDKVFLKLFPDFVTVFNSLFNEEDHMVLKEGQLLNTELRIFALIRMGVHDHEKIAKILDYSVTTIYTYKTRLRNKSIVSTEEFDRRIMSIRAI